MSEWRKWVSMLQSCFQIHFPRPNKEEEEISHQTKIHCFQLSFVVPTTENCTETSEPLMACIDSHHVVLQTRCRNLFSPCKHRNSTHQTNFGEAGTCRKTGSTWV